jgi:hypothetical protein
MKLPWFKRNGILLYIPQNLAGWIIVLAGITYAIYSFIDIDSRSHSVSDTVRPFFINLILIFAGYTLLAFFVNSLTKER